MRRFVYVIGMPGSGKTTLLRALFRDCIGTFHDKPFAHTVYETLDGPPVVEIGKDRWPFGGTDALSMSIQPTVEEWIQTCDYTRFIAEGDRLANNKFFNSIERRDDWLLTVMLMNIDDEIAKERRRVRSEANADALQSRRWINGRITKTDKLASYWVDPEWTLDALRPTSDLIMQLLQHPALTQLKRTA